MLLKAFVWKLLSFIGSLIWVQVQIVNQDYLKSITKATLELIQGNQLLMNLTSSCNDTANFSWTDYLPNSSSFCSWLKNDRRNEWTFGGHNSDNGLLNVTTKVEVPGIIYEPPQKVLGQWERFVRRAPKCTWSSRLGFKLPIFHSPSPGYLSRAVSTLFDIVLNLRSKVNDFRLKYSPDVCRIRRYIPWEQNAPVELAVVWTVAIILYAGISWYEQKAAAERTEHKKRLGTNFMTVRRAKFREAIPDLTTPEDSESDDADFNDDQYDEKVFRMNGQ